MTNFLSKTPRLRAELTGENVTLLGRRMVGLLSLDVVVNQR